MENQKKYRYKENVVVYFER